MKASELRQAILQAAVQGQLVPQDHNDEPASELLKRIQQEKARLIRDGKIKKDKPLPPIKEDDVPYDLPGGWVWCRLGTLGDVQSSKRVFTSEFVDTGIPFYRGTEIGALATNKEIVSKYYVTPKHYHDLINHTGKPVIGDLLMPSICPDGRVWLVDTDAPFYFKDGRVLWVRLGKNHFNNKYIQHALKARLISDYINIASGTTFAELKIFLLKEICIPLPPLAEQHRIVAKMDELMALCDELETAEQELDALEDRFSEYLPKSILQAAVQGKLVEQDSRDEPASELLKRIQKDKARLIKDGKIKKDKPQPPIGEDEMPYDLPDGWVWCRLGDVGEIVGGATPLTTESSYYTTSGSGIAWITPADMKNTKDSFISRGSKDITIDGYNSCSTRLLPAGSVVYSSRAPIGLIAYAENELCTNQGFKSVVPYEHGTNGWLFYILKSITSSIISRASGTTFLEVSGEFMKKEMIPLPPLAEQQRIVAKVDELMVLCGELAIARTSISKIDLAKIIPFPQQSVEDEYEDIGMAARGDGAEHVSDKLRKAIDDWDDEDE